MNNNFSDLLDSVDASTFARDPRPGWSGPALLFGAASCSVLGPPPAARFLAAGIPIDSTSSSRPGAAEGPAALRQASLVFSSYVDSLGEHEMFDMRTNRAFRYERAELFDAGDLHVYPTDNLRTFCAVAAEVRCLAATGAKLLLFGGDHSISFPTFTGWQRAMRETIPLEQLGYVQIDHHFDFGNESALHGSLYHGSNARRISELPGMAPDRMAFLGVGSVTRKLQLDALRDAGYHVVPAVEIQRRGVESGLEGVIAHLRRRCRAIYLSIDIDVLDCSVAPGTGNVTIGGLSAGDLFDMVEQLATLPLGAVDITEIAPRYDPTGRTAQIAARLLFEFVYRHA